MRGHSTSRVTSLLFDAVIQRQAHEIPPGIAMSIERARAIFEEAAFVRDLGIRLDAVSAEGCETSVAVSTRLTQQDGFAHAHDVIRRRSHVNALACSVLR